MTVTTKPIPTKQGKANGYSLIEVVVAIFILIIGILAILPMLALNVRSNVAAKNYGIANYLVQQKMEAVKSWPIYDDQTAISSDLYGITENNAALFSPELNISVQNWNSTYNRYTELFHNGYTINNQGFLFGDTSTGYGIDEGSFGNRSLNTGKINPSGGGFKGEDFKMVRVRVEWEDVFGHHEISRQMFISRF